MPAERETQAQGPSARDRQVRVFISSTFRDMQAERDHLVTVVFPELRERVEQLGLEFFDVDLRWGVPGKDANGETANSWEYCRQWIDRVEPFFVCVLGQRYGWVPEPEQLKVEEDKRRQQDERRSITDMEVRHAVLNTKLKRRSYFYLRATEAPATASEYVDPPPLLGKLEQLKNEIRSCGRPVRDYPCEWTGNGFADMEKFGRRVLDDLWSGVLRDERYVSKEVWHQVLKTDPDTDPRYTDESRPVPPELWKEIVDLAKPTLKEPLDAEREQMDAFAASRLRWFQGRTRELQQLTDFLQFTATNAPRLAVVAAMPGQGKSALLAKFSTLIPGYSTFLITHFVGATERSATAHSLVERLLGELDRSGIAWPVDEQKEAVFEQYGSQAEAATVHYEMADYFTACAKGTDPHKEWETDSVRGFAECVYQLIKAGQHEQAAGLLINFPFLLHKLRVGLLRGVFEDYDIFCREAPSEVAKRLEIWGDFFSEKAHILRRGNGEWPAHKILLQLAVEHADDSPLTTGAEQWLKEDRSDWLWLRRVPRLPHAQKNPCLAVLEGHTGIVKGALALADGRLLSWSNDETLRLWDSKSGQCLTVLEGHTKWVKGALALADGRLLSWSGDKILRLWDSKSGQWLTVLKGHTDSVNGALALADGRLLSWSMDKTLRLWDRHSGKCLAVLEGHTHDVLGALALAGGRLLSWSNDKTLRLWDSTSGAHLVLLKGHKSYVKGALILADGRLVSWSNDKTLRLWDSANGACLAVLKGHTDSVNGALALTDGRLLSWSMDDKTLRLWDGTSGSCLVVLEGHTEWVNGALALADGQLLSWSVVETLHLWNGHCGACLEVVPAEQTAIRHPEWLFALRKAQNHESVVGDFFIDASVRSAHLRHKTVAPIIVSWNAESGSAALCLLPDGTAIVASGQVCILKLYQGNRRVSVAEAEEILFSQKKVAK